MVFKKGYSTWNKGLTKETDERVRKCAEAKIGKHVSEETKQKIREKAIGRTNWGKGLTKETDERVMKQSILLRGRPKSKEHKKKLSLLYKGKTYEEIHGKELADKIKQKQRLASIKNESHKYFPNIAGKNNPNWKGGTQYEPYDNNFDEIFKNKIKERDNYCCLICNTKEEEQKYSLSVHHIDYNKTNSIPQNCASLCRNHHSDTNFNRGHWKAFFQSLLSERYGYKYTEDGKIIIDLEGINNG